MEKTQIPLSRYIKIVKGEEAPLFKLLKKIECKKQSSLDSMWAEHEKQMRLFQNEKNKDFTKLRKEEDAEYSLLDLKHDISLELLKCCVFCERKCKVNRSAGEKGWCRVGAVSHISTMFEHFGEERVLVPSGTIFFTGCTWRCVYCQNWDISQFPERGRPISGADIAKWIDTKSRFNQIINANFVGGDPTPNLHTIVDTIKNCKTNTPMIWNSNMYLSMETVRLLEGVVDVFLADFRYGNNECAMRLSSVPKYFETITRNFLKIAQTTEVIIRILVLPNHVEDDTKPILEWIGKNIADKVYVNLMRQYRPDFRASEFEDIARSLNKSEYEKAVIYLKQYNIKYYETQ
jgi:putative pyruvate formate lyase activating enzyme